MIKASELRIGNAIWDDTRNKIKWVTHRVISDLASHASPLPYSPIPLTPEWLERCGFKWDKGFMKIDLKHVRMSLGLYAGVSDKMSLFQTSTPGEGSIEMEFGFGSNHPKYLHQLQNLYFALTGEELPIKL